MKKVILDGKTSKKSIMIVVAKFKEELSWINDIKNIPCIVYDKKNKKAPHYLPNIPTFPVQKFEGIKHTKSPTGRESHTYLYHIIKHYDDLAEMNIFLQGRPMEHFSDTRATIKILLDNDFKDINFLPLNFPLVICDEHAAPLHTGLPIERIFTRLFQNPCPELFAYTWGAMFCVSKEFIRHRPLAFYEEMMQIVYEEPLSGYVYERLWPTILGCHRFIPYSSYPKKDRGSWNLPGLI